VTQCFIFSPKTANFRSVATTKKFLEKKSGAKCIKRGFLLEKVCETRHILRRKKVTSRHIQTISFWRSPEQSEILKKICSFAIISDDGTRGIALRFGFVSNGRTEEHLSAACIQVLLLFLLLCSHTHTHT
jgi:hypothetical protein